jgi:hypothetical protein
LVIFAAYDGDPFAGPERAPSPGCLLCRPQPRVGWWVRVGGWAEAMLAYTHGLQAFFTMAPAPDVDFLFLADTATVQAAWEQQLAAALLSYNLTDAQVQFWRQRLLFARDTLPQLNQSDPDDASRPLLTLLGGWNTLTRQITWIDSEARPACPCPPHLPLARPCP